MSTYCQYVQQLTGDEEALHQHYHRHQYGFPLQDDNELFGRLLLEINQAGLSWTTILKKQEQFREAYSQFHIATIATYGPADRERLLANPGIIRNRLKVDAAIHNAGVVLQLQQEYGSFRQWLLHHHPLTKDQWVKLFKKQFRFTGGEILNEFLLSTGFLPGAHHESCPVFAEIAKLRPPWMQP